MKTAAAIVTNRGGRTWHAAIVSRELGVPSIVGTGNATEKIATGRTITVSCAEVHPMALVHPERVAGEEETRLIGELTFGYEDKQAFFVEKLAEGIGTIAAAFYPKPVVVRLSDFKTNEYASLIGGKAFEPAEENPMIGFRGASRYYDEREYLRHERLHL